MLGPLTTLVGTNASGKSNLRDAFRFLHGIGRGYPLADVLGGHSSESGERVWNGIRGASREIAYHSSSSFTVECEFFVPEVNDDVIHTIEVDVGDQRRGPLLKAERLLLRSNNEALLTAWANEGLETDRLGCQWRDASGQMPVISWNRRKSVVSDYLNLFGDCPASHLAQHTIEEYAGIRFLEPDPEVMRESTLPGQVVLGDHGENLSSVLQSMYLNKELKNALIQWLQELTPMDASDLDFEPELSGKILVQLVEKSGIKISALSASDGTLIFLALAAAILAPSPGRTYFFEELEFGIHPARLYLLMQLFDQQLAKGQLQIITTTHSPQLLRLVPLKYREFVQLAYRSAGRQDTQIKRIVDIPDAERVLAGHDIARLHETGWMENAVSFTEGAASAA